MIIVGYNEKCSGLSRDICNLIVVVQPLSCVQLFVTPWIAECQASLSSTISQSLLKLTSIELMMSPNHLLLCHPFSFCPQSFPASESFPMSRFFTSCGPSIGASASASIIPINIQGPLGLTSLISLQSKGLSSLLHHHSLKASILWLSPFFMVQLSYPYMTTRKTIALTKWTFVGKVMSLFFNLLSRFVIAFLPRSKGLLI